MTELYLVRARLPRESLHIGNLGSCFVDGESKIPEKRLQVCAEHHLPDLIARVKPELIVLMGGPAAKLAEPRTKLDMYHGIPAWRKVFGWEGWVWPSYEPALGMRDTPKMAQLVEDFTHLGEWLRGEWEHPSEKIARGEGLKSKDYLLVGTTDRDIDNFEHYLNCAGMQRPMREDWRAHPAVDTEKHGKDAWSVQLSVASHTGRMVKAGNKRAVEALARWMHSREVRLHNAGQDLDTLDQIGIRVTRFTDTMQEAYHLCSLPQGLKVLAFRLLGVTMRSWKDVVWPASLEVMVEWMRAAAAYAGAHQQSAVVHEFKRARCVDCGHQHTTGRCKSKINEAGEKCGCESTNTTNHRVEYKAGPIEAVLAHVLRYTVDAEETEEEEKVGYNPWTKIAKMKATGLRGKVAARSEWDEVEDMIGEMPILGIGNVEEAEAVEYGCSDADHTGLVGMELETRRQGEEWVVDREDWDQGVSVRL